MVRQVKLSDYEDIKEIKYILAYDLGKLNNSAYRVDIQKSGFLTPGEYSQQNHEEDMQKIFLTYEEEGKAVAYLRVDEVQEMKKNDNARWFMPELQEVYFSIPHADIGGIAVSPGADNHGIASAMLEEAEKKVREKGIPYLFSFVILNTITNFPSLMFHEKNGFERVAMVSVDELFGLKNFASILYGKKLG